MKKFEQQSFENLLKDFYNLTGMKTCLYDADGNELCYYPGKLSDFCKILRKDEKMDARCRECDRLAFANCRKNRTQYVYSCHAGLRECISPILFENRIIGFIMIGQINGSDSEAFARVEKELPPELSAELKDAYNRLPLFSSEKLLSAFRVLDACAGYELLKTLMLTKNDPIDSRIDEYIHSNLSAPLSVSHLCSEFHLSRYEIYNICKEYFAFTPAEYIKNCRLAHACNLLATTALPIKDIAERCGIPDYNYFSKIFKSSYKLSPTQYRKAQKSI